MGKQVKTIIWVLVIGFLLFYLVTNPEGAANAVRTVGSAAGRSSPSSRAWPARLGGRLQDWLSNVVADAGPPRRALPARPGG